MMRRRRAVLDRDLPYLVAELEGYVVGFCYASQFRPREGYRYTVEDSIYVRADCIGHGVGRMLLAELISECQAKGCHSMVACICGVNVPSVSLHAGSRQEIWRMAAVVAHAASPAIGFPNASEELLELKACLITWNMTGSSFTINDITSASAGCRPPSHADC
jgi:GNAT superfamily N-acetyltransferase